MNLLIRDLLMYDNSLDHAVPVTFRIPVSSFDRNSIIATFSNPPSGGNAVQRWVAAAIAAEVASAGIPYFWPGYFSIPSGSPSEPNQWYNYSDLNQCNPGGIEYELATSSIERNYRDENGNGIHIDVTEFSFIKDNATIGKLYESGTSGSPWRTCTPIGIDRINSSGNRPDESAPLYVEVLFFTSDGYVGVYRICGWAWGQMCFLRWFDIETSEEIISWFTSLPTPDAPDTDPYNPYSGGGDLPGGDTITVPSLPPLTATATGIIGLFAPSVSEMALLADFMWTDFGGTGTTVVDVLAEIVEALKRSISNPLDYVFGLSLIPSQGLTIGSSTPVRFGWVSSGVSMPRLLSQYFVVDCGTLSFDSVCGDTFLDYAPYSKFSVYLPYIGFVDVDANDFVGHTIGVVYHGDVVSGALTAYITKDSSVMYQYTGNCSVNIPLSSDSWAETISAAIGLVHSIELPGNLTGTMGDKIKSVIKGVKEIGADSAACIAGNPSLLSPNVRHSGAIGGTSGAMGVQVPFVLREAVAFHSTKRFNSITGYPSIYYKRLGSVSGYTEVMGVHIENINATKEEIQEIENLLMGGVIL